MLWEDDTEEAYGCRGDLSATNANTLKAHGLLRKSGRYDQMRFVCEETKYCS